MANYLLAYHGGTEPANAEEGAKVMEAWMAWFGELGGAVVDGGNPVGRAWTIQGDGTVEGGGGNPVTGYSVLAAESMDAALVMAKGCPHLSAGGTIELCETYDASTGPATGH